MLRIFTREGYNYLAMKRITLLIAICLSALLLASVMLTARAAMPSQSQPIPTPTPGPDGKIIWIVQPGQSCILISTLTNVPVDVLRALNKLDETCLINPGDRLLIGVGGPSSGGTPESGPTPTPTQPLPTPTTVPGSIDVCVLLYEDLNGDSIHQDAEPAIEGGVVSIAGTSGQYSQTATTQSGTDPICFTKVPLGTFNISVAVPAGYNPTSALNYTLDINQGDVKVGPINAGDRVYVDFGAQKSTQPVTTTAQNSAGNNNSVLGIIGGALLLAGAGLAFYAWRVYGRGPKYL